MLATSHLATALKLLDRVAAALALELLDVWLRPWQEGERMTELRFCTPPPGDVPEPWRAVGPLLEAAGRLSSTWTIVLPGERSDARIAFQGWTPPDFRTFLLEGLVHAAFVVETAGGKPEAVPSAGVRTRLTRAGLMVNIAVGET